MVQSKLPSRRQKKVHWKVNNKILWKKKPERYDSSRKKISKKKSTEKILKVFRIKERSLKELDKHFWKKIYIKSKDEI